LTGYCVTSQLNKVGAERPWFYAFLPSLNLRDTKDSSAVVGDIIILKFSARLIYFPAIPKFKNNGLSNMLPHIKLARSLRGLKLVLLAFRLFAK
jgi:hypothetical protein